MSRDDFEAVVREQAVLRERLAALDRKIAALRVAREEEVFAAEPEIAAPVRREVPPALPSAAFRETEPPVLPENLPEHVSEAAPEVAPKASWEFKLGTVWLVRIGIVVLLTGFVFLANYAYQTIVPHLGPGAKLGLLYLLGGALAVLGARMEKRSAALQNYGRVLLAGGVALIYYATYGASFVQKIRVIENPLAGGLLLLAVGGGILWLAERRQAQSVALMAILLSYYTSAINPVGLFSLYSSLLLTAAAVFLLLRHRWTTVSFLSLAGTYASYAFWRFHRGGVLDFAAAPAEFWHGSLFLFGYWVLFTVAVHLSRSVEFSAEKRTPFLSLNNSAFFGLVFQSIHANHPAWDGRFCLIFGAVLLGLAALASRKQAEDFSLDGAYLMQGLGVLTLGLTIELSGYQLALALAVQGAMMLFGMNRRHGWVYEMAAGLVAVGAFAVGSTTLAPGLFVGLTLVGIFILDAWLSRHFRKTEYRPAFDWRAAGYGILVVLQSAAVVDEHVPGRWQSATFCLITLALLLAGSGLKLVELASVGQLLSVFAGVSFLFHGAENAVFTETRALLVATPLLLVHWWQRQKSVGRFHLGQVFFSFLTLAVASRWILDYSPGSSLLFWIGGLALISLVYGVLTGAVALAVVGQLWIVWCAGLFFEETLWNDAPAFWPTLTLILVAADWALLHLFTGKFDEITRKGLAVWQLAISALVFLMISSWGWNYVELPGRMLFFVVFSAAILFLASRGSWKDPLQASLFRIYAALATLFGLVIFAIDLARHAAPSGWNVAALLVIGAECHFLRNSLKSAIVRCALMSIVVAGLWAEMNRWISFSGTHFPKSLAWALLAMAFLSTGLLIRERTYRIGGFLLLFSATIRMLFFDVEGLARILCFIAVGLVILALGFIYNRFAEKFREWL